MAKALLKEQTVATTSFPFAVKDLVANFNQVGKFKVAGADLESGALSFPDALQLLTKGRRPQGSEQAIIKAYLDVVQKLNVLCGHLKDSTTPSLGLVQSSKKAMNTQTGHSSSLALVPYNSIKVLPTELPTTEVPSESASPTCKTSSEAFVSDISTILGGSPMLAWLFGPTVQFLKLFSFVRVPVQRCFMCLPQIILGCFIYLGLFCVGKVLTEPEVLFDLVLSLVSALPKYAAFAVPRIGSHILQLLSNSVPNIVSDSESMSGMAYQLPLFSIVCWMLARVGR